MKWLAHLQESGQGQTVEEHLQGTAARAAKFAAAFNAEAWGAAAGMLHDIGKCSEAFQKRLNGAPDRVDHATAGAQEAQKMGCLPLAFVVAGHHGGLPDGGNSRFDRPEDATLMGRLKRRELPPYEIPLPVKKPARPPFPVQNKLELSFFTRMLYSCLVDADFLDTEQFMQGNAAKRGGYASLETLCDRLDWQLKQWDQPTTQLNQKRSEILRQCQCGGAKPRGLYTMTVPTGGGKTTASMAFALHHAKENQMDRVIYVIPYTSIIEQNAKVFEQLLGEENVVQHHSNVEWGDEETETDACNLRKRLSTENWDAPVVVTTAVQFFESMYGAKPSRCRKLHHIANSVIIFDEAQTLPLPYLRPCVAAMAELVRHYQSTVVLCTATQPSLGPLFREFAPEWTAEELCPGADGPCFRRYSLQQAGTLSDAALAQRLSAERQVLCIVNSRAKAQRVYAQLEQPGSFHLSTMMTPAHRHSILEEIRRRLKAGEVCRVVSTSLIEAGVDVDFPTVYREEAGLDSILQAAGRCNREGKRPAEDSLVWVFRSDAPAPPQFRQQIGILRETEDCFADLTSQEAVSAYFTALFTLRPEELDQKKILKALQEGIDGCDLPFRQVAERVRLVESGTTPVVIPCDAIQEELDLLKRRNYAKGLLRKLGSYCVNVYPQHLRALQQAGAVMDVDSGGGLYVLLQTDLYHKDTGLSLEIRSGAGFFVE